MKNLLNFIYGGVCMIVFWLGLWLAKFRERGGVGK